MLKTILCLATLDTKGREVQYLKEIIRKRGHNVLILDISSLGSPHCTPDVPADEVAQAAGSTLAKVRALTDAGQAAEVMTAGAIQIVLDLYRAKRFDGVIGIGGGMGSAMGTTVMRELPVGVPKFMLSSQQVVQAGLRWYVGTSDIAIMPSLADIAGLNRLTMKSLSNAASAIIGMVESPEIETMDKPLVFMTMLGTTTGCGLKVMGLLEKKGFEVIVFHTIGIGGMTFENLVTSYPVSGVIELGLNEIGNELFGGFATAGSNRLEAAGRKGIPQVITPGNAELISFFGPETVPDRYRDRTLHHHNPQATGIRLNADEMRSVAETIAKKINLATGPVKVLIPRRGFSALDREGGDFYDPAADRAFIESLRSSLHQKVQTLEIDAHINDDEFAVAVADELTAMLKTDVI